LIMISPSSIPTVMVSSATVMMLIQKNSNSI
jgi:hypothetical protein